MATKKKKKTATAKKAKAKKAAPKKAKKVAKKPAKKAKAAKAPKAPKAAPKKVGPTPPPKPVLVKPKNQTQYTQAEFFECVRGFCGFNNRREAKEFFDSFTGMIQNALKSGYKIALPGLGKLQVRKTKARMGINPLTKEPIKISAKKRVRFTANKALKEAVL